MTIVAHLYYVEGLTQKAIAERVKLSRPAVVRVLQRARDLDIVEVRIKRPVPGITEDELELERRFGLRIARVVPTDLTPEKTLDSIGKTGAEVLESLIQTGSRIGVAWSRTVHAILPHSRRPKPHIECIVNEIAGTYLDASIPYGVSWQLSEILGVPLQSIPVPILVKNSEVRKTMLKEQVIARAAKNASQVDFAIVGLGDTTRDSSLVGSGHIGPADLRELRERRAAGEIVARFYDIEGARIRMSFDDRVVALKWDEIKRIPLVIAMAYGPSKVEPIIGALRGRIIQGLITDRVTAEAVLAANKSFSEPKVYMKQR